MEDPTPLPPRDWGLPSVALVLALTVAGCGFVLAQPKGSAAAEADLSQAVGLEHPSRVGLQPYDGPVTGAQVLAACMPDTGTAALGCWSLRLDDLLEGKGAVVAFDALEQMGALDPVANQQGHALAHGLGRYAFDAYGSIGRALTNCSYKVFGGCVHGALQSYFDSLGRPVNGHDVSTVCPGSPPFAQYTCLHGLGHGLMLNLNYDLNASLHLCDALDGWFAQDSCYGGVFMENWVGYLDSISPTAAGGHDHNHGGPPPTFFINASDPSYPCDIVAPKYGDGCWIMQTSIILYFHPGDWAFAGHVCEGVTDYEHSYTCFKSLGRDVGPATNRDMPAAEALCDLVKSGAPPCVKGVVAEMTLNAVDPMVGLNACKQVVDPLNKKACYEEFAWQSVGMVGKERMRAICAQSESGYQADCIRGAQL